MHSKQLLFNIARFGHENEMQRKALKQKKNFESSPFWNPQSTELESGIQYSKSGIHRVESRIQDCHGFPYMGRNTGCTCVRGPMSKCNSKMKLA